MIVTGSGSVVVTEMVSPSARPSTLIAAEPTRGVPSYSLVALAVIVRGAGAISSLLLAKDIS